MFGFFVFATKTQHFSVAEVSVENYICIMQLHMQETYKYSILEEKHVTLQMGSSMAMKESREFESRLLQIRSASNDENIQVFQ